MCPECYDKLSFSDFRPNRIIDGVNIYTCAAYDKTLQKLIRGLKYHNQKELAFYLAKFMYEYWKHLGDKRIFRIAAVPLHKNRIKKRKYNHMELVAFEFGKLAGMEVNNDLIKRIKDTKPQYKLSRNERINNLSGAFEAVGNSSEPVLILDDICTTGATFEEIIKTLKNNGTKQIVCLSASSPIY